MNRWARSALAISVGFAAGTAVFQAAGMEPLGVGGPVVLGSAEVDDYCRDMYGNESNAMLIGAGAYAWQCSTRTNDVFRFVEVDFDELCDHNFGGGAVSNNWDTSDPYAWECIEE